MLTGTCGWQGQGGAFPVTWLENLSPKLALNTN